MTKPIAPEIVALNADIFANRLKLHDCLRDASIHRSTWSRWVKGGGARLDTVEKLRAVVAKRAANQTCVSTQTQIGK